MGGTPSLSLGAVDGPAESVLYRVSGAFRLSDGRLVVGNAGTREVRFYLSDGTLDLATGLGAPPRGGSR